MQKDVNELTSFCNVYVKYLHSIHDKWSEKNREWIEEMEMKFDRLLVMKNFNLQKANVNVEVY